MSAAHTGFRLGRAEPRTAWAMGGVCVLLSIVGIRLVELQGLDRGGYALAANEQRTGTVALRALRGTIEDRFGTPLAYTSDAQDITADPSQINADERPDYAKALAPYLGKKASDIEKALTVPGRYALLGRALSLRAATDIERLTINDEPIHGIYTQATTLRQYPGKTIGANVLGLVHDDGSGAAGIEYQFNSLLSGKDGSLTFSVDGRGQINPSGPQQRKPAVDGATVRLTLDQDLQAQVQRTLDDIVDESGARGGQVAVLSKSGEVLALAQNNTFDASDPSSITSKTQLNAPIQSVFEPGSVNKLVTFSAAIDKHMITPTEVFNVPGRVSTGGVTVGDAWPHPTQPFTATGVLAESSNVGTLQIAQRIGPQTWDDYEKRFGVGQKTGVELPGESDGILPEIAQWSDSSFANLPIGQGVALTVLQLASMYQTIANDGVRIPPRITESITQPNGEVHATATPAGVQVMSVESAHTVRTMLESVTLAGGTGKRAAIPGYRIAGKTGTAQQPDPAKGGAYSTSMNWVTFAGVAPADDPQFVVAVMIDAPAHSLEGGEVAAPLYRQIATYELQHARIPPTGSASTHVPLFACNDKVRIFYGNGVC